MIELHFYDKSPLYYIDDIETIKKALESRGYTADEYAIKQAWEQHSDEYAAGWLVLPDSEEEIISIILEHMKS